MNITTNLPGRLRNTSLPRSHGLLPVFEAVVNSVHAIEEAQVSSEDGRIRVMIERAPAQQQLTVDDKPTKSEQSQRGDVVAFAVTDNGIGFNDENFEAFMTLDTERKATKGGRGIGRLLWLKAFDRAEVTSRFVSRVDGLLYERSFVFNASGVTGGDMVAAQSGGDCQTSVRLEGFGTQYRAYSRKTGEAIANTMLGHCMWYFVRSGGAPTIVVEDAGETISLDELFDQHMHSSAVSKTLTVNGTDFGLLHVKLRAGSLANHSIAYCADNRLVLEEKLAGLIPGLHGKLEDANGEFFYICYVSSPLLDQRVRPERNAFNLPMDVGSLFEGVEVSWEDIRKSVAKSAAEHLSDCLAGVKAIARERIQDFVANRAPRYRPILGRLTSEELDIDPNISDKELELTLHHHLAALEQHLISTGHELMVPRQGESAEEYRSRIDDYLRTVEDIKKSDLANYVAHRRVVLDLLESAIQRLPDGGYAREELIHTLIMPMRADSNETGPDDSNLWLIDERLAFHDYLASDKTLAAMPITGATDTKEPDLIGLKVFDNPLLVAEGPAMPLASIVVIEIKRPMRNDATSGEVDDPIEQALSYLDRVREGKVQTPTGRPIPRSENIPGFCYVICDLTSSILRRCKMHDLKRTDDAMGYFGYKESLRSYVEVISFDRLVNAAKQRNKAFFDKLGLPTN